jgi:hypothetical protein
MKKLSPLIMTCFLVINGLAKGNTNLIPIDSVTGKAGITQIIYSDSLSKKQLYRLALQWASVEFGALSGAIAVQDANEGKIVIKTSKIIDNHIWAGTTGFSCNCTVTMNFKDGKCRIEITDMYFTGLYKYKPYDNQTMETTLANAVSHRPADVARSKTWIKEASDALHGIINDFSAYVKESREAKNNW